MPAEISDDTLLVRLRQRDEEALAALYDRYAGLVYTLALRIVGDRHLAEEVLQDTFWRCWRGADQIDLARGHPGAWLVRVARNRSIDLLRSRQHQDRRAENALLDPPDDMRQLQHTWSEADFGEQVVLHDALGYALGSLSPVQRQAIELAYYGGLTQVEIATTLGIPLGTVKTRLRDGLERMRQSLSPVYMADARVEAR